MIRIFHTLVLLALGCGSDAQGYGHFNGGSISVSVRNDTRTGKLFADLDVLTGWVLGKGPCGTHCNTADVGKSTNNTRLAVETSMRDNIYFGIWSLYIREKGITRLYNLNTMVRSNMTERVLRFDTEAKWEQERMKVSLELDTTDKVYREDLSRIVFEGESWHPLSMQSNKSDWEIRAPIDSRSRNDTGVPNRTPLVLTRPMYRLKLNTKHRIDIAAADPDKDYIKCSIAKYGQSGGFHSHRLPGVTIYENCSVVIDTDETKYQYFDGAWGAITVSVRDFNKHLVTLGGNEMNVPYSYIPMSHTSVQFAVQVLQNFEPPTFVAPTVSANHHFILYNGAVWKQKVYAKSSPNRTISEFKAFGREEETIAVSALEDGPVTSVRFVEVAWIPNANEAQNHIICITAIDDTGVESDEDRCFTIETMTDAFNHSGVPVKNSPYFTDLPDPGITVECPVGDTCVLPLFISSNTVVERVVITNTIVEKTDVSPVEIVRRNGRVSYEAYLSFQDRSYGIKNICWFAIDTNKNRGEQVCIKTKITTDPCRNHDCKNSATCERSDKDPTTYTCRCISDVFFGRYCENKRDLCIPNPCNNGTCYNFPPARIYCDCSKIGREGDRCEKGHSTCQPYPCVHGTCKVMNTYYASCTCNPGYAGEQCEPIKSNINNACCLA